MPKIKETRLEIDLDALAHNFQIIKEQVAPSTQIMGVVKAFAYGTDSIVIGEKLVQLGASHLAVAYIEEGMRFRRRGIKVPILVFYPQLEDLPKLIKYNLIPSVYNFHFLETLQKRLKRRKISNFPIHIKMNTGMNRLGFDLEDLSKIKDNLLSHECVQVTGLFSHFSSAGSEEEDDFTREQINKFSLARSYFKVEISSDFIAHLANSSGILSHPEASYDMVRAGIALYGYGNNPKEQSLLKPVASLKTVIAQLRKIPKGASVGYDRKFKAKQPTQIATLPLGYADGISRIYGNGNAQVIIRGQKAPIVGNVCMDTLMVDVTGIECQEGDEVEVFGQQQSALDFDKNKQSIPYELITRISRRVTRVFLNENTSL
ncbi:MAG: alanine racemase [Flavobacteriaceae bacterium]|nr:alanine racemase [Flavobacteriaceae bacterium]